MLVKSLLESRDFDLSILATREQVAEVKSDFQKEFDKIDKNFSTLEDKIDKNKYDLVKWLVTLFITIIIAIYLKR